VTRFVQISAKLNFCFPNDTKIFKPRLSYLLLITSAAQPCCMWAQGSSTSPAAWVCRVQAFFKRIPIFKAPQRLKYYVFLPIFFTTVCLPQRGLSSMLCLVNMDQSNFQFPPLYLFPITVFIKEGRKWETLAFCIPFEFRGGGGG